MSRPTRLLAALGLGVVLALAIATPASAHASLVSVDPPDGARLDDSPEVVRLTFSERVSVGLGGVRVLDAEGEAVHDGAATAEGEVVEVGIDDDLPDGTYVISYRVTSADGHPVRGGSVFAVGDVEVDRGALGRVAGGGGDRGWEVAGAVARGVAYAGILLVAGGVAFLVLVDRESARPLTLRWLRLASAIGAVAAAVALPVQAALGTGEGPAAIFDDGVLAEVARDGVGLGALLAVAGALVAAVAVVRAPNVALVGGAVAAASFAASGHTRAGSLRTLATVADVTHLWVVAAWSGGLALLVLTLRARRADPDPRATVTIVARFSTLATVTLVLAGATGTLLGWREVRTLDGLTSSGYGRILLAKVLLVGWVAALGAYNHLRLVPAAQSGKASAALAQLRSTVRLELLTLVGVIALTAVLVAVTPPRDGGGVVERTVFLGEAGSAQITVAPASAGFNQVHVYLFDPDGRPADIAETLTLVFELPDAGIGPITREAVRAGPAHLQLDTSDLAVPGRWTLEVQARVDRFTEERDRTEIPIT